MNIPMSGRLVTALDGTQLNEGDFQILKNMRYTEASIKSISGMTKINPLAMDSVYTRPRAGFQFRIFRPVAINPTTASGIIGGTTPVPPTPTPPGPGPTPPGGVISVSLDTYVNSGVTLAANQTQQYQFYVPVTGGGPQITIVYLTFSLFPFQTHSTYSNGQQIPLSLGTTMQFKLTVPNGYSKTFTATSEYLGQVLGTLPSYSITSVDLGVPQRQDATTGILVYQPMPDSAQGYWTITATNIGAVSVDINVTPREEGYA